MKWIILLVVFSACTPEIVQEIGFEPCIGYQCEGIDIYPEVWSSNGYDGETFEYKVNCGQEYDGLELCFLWNLTNVTVTTPLGDVIVLEKDFNLNEYDNEFTRRWVIYGPQEGGLPEPGEYLFSYYENELVYTNIVNYTPSTIDRPRNVEFEQRGRDLYVEWLAPETDSEMWYKVLIFPDDGEVISKVFTAEITNATLEDVPLEVGATGTVNVALYYRNGYAYSEYHDLTWS